MTPRTIADRYRIERKLGEGGMAEVFLVHDALEDRPLALKLLKEGEHSRDYFMHEFRVLARLDHPNLVEVYDFGVTAGEDGRELCYYTCEFLEGQDLFAATRAMDLDGLYEVAVAVLEALAYIHDRGLVHYDVKPENVSVRTIPATRPGMRSRYRVKLVDFGLTGEATTRRGEKIKGTVHYVAPEVAKSLPADRRADLYSLGITLYYVVTGQLPYDGNSAISIIRKHIEGVPAPPTSVRADVPEAWAGFILRLIEKEPADRFASAPEAIHDLARRLGKFYDPRPLSDSGVRPGVPTGGGGALSPSFAGRRDELRQLVAALPRPGAACAQVLWIEGEEGVGKTRLIYELKVQAQLLGVPFLDAVCVKEGDDPFKRIVGLALTLPDVRPLAGGLERELTALFPGVLAALGEATEAEADEGHEERRAAEPEVLRGQLDRVAELLLRAAEVRPYVLVLEDVRRASEITVALLGVLLRAIVTSVRRGHDPGLVVVLTDRPGGESGEMTARAEGIPEELAGLIVEDLGELRRQLSAGGLLAPISLLRLSGSETAEMVGSMLALDPPDLDLCAKVYEVTGGNPLFVEELVRSLTDDGLLTPRRRVRQRDLARIEAPRSLGELLGRRLARLPEDTRAVLVALAVLVAPSPLRLVARTAKRSTEASLDALDLLVRRQLVQRRDDPDGGPPRYALAHAQVQRSVLKSISRRALAATHRRALGALEDEVPEGPGREEMLERLARHAVKAGDQEAALRYATAAGMRAQTLGNPQQAIDLLDRALELLRWEDVVEDPAEQRRQEALVLTRLSEVLATVGRYKDAARALEELLALGEDALPAGAGVWARRRLGDLAVRQGSAAEARRWLREALDAAGDDPDPAMRAERARVLEVMSRTALWQGDYLQVIALAGEAIEIFRELGRPGDALWVLGVLATTEYFRGEVGRASEHLRECLRLSRGAAPGHRATLERLGCPPAEAAELDRALTAFEQASGERLLRPAGDAFGLVLSSSVLSSWFDLKGDAEVAARFYEACLDGYQRVGDAQRTALAHNNLGVARRHQGRLSDALRHFELSLAIHEGTGDRQGGAVALVNLALLLLAVGDGSGALARARRALTLAREIGLTWLTGHAHRVQGRVHALLGAHAEADRELSRAAGVFRMVGNPRSLADLLLDRAEGAALAKNAPQARAFLTRAREAGGDDKAPDFLSRERLLLGGSRLEQDPARALDDLEAALRLATRAGLAELELEARRGLAACCTRLGTLRLAQQHLDAAHELAARLTSGLDPKLRDHFERTPGSARARETSRLLVERSLED